MNEDDIYLKIGRVLLDTSPETASKVIVEAELSPENDHCKLLFDYVDQHGNQDWFSPVSVQVDTDLFNCLVELRKIYIHQEMTAGLPVWNGCVMSLDVIAGKLTVDFRYEQPVAEE